MELIAFANDLNGDMDVTQDDTVDCTTMDIRCLIDVSTDGMDNDSSTSPADAVANALDAGIDQVNCLGVGEDADCTWNDAGSFDVLAEDFDAFSNALNQKLAREGIVDLPEPSTLLVLGLGLVGLGFARRKRAA